ncbi:MAG TPA: hypothetical protein PLD81_09905, partial [Elusimicrobiales bacterium]|nr:hypothetical protein [Elusimicrobiales bacterium]HPO96303.1 hypothetical protein [Elusimicrobiales bacterium]
SLISYYYHIFTHFIIHNLSNALFEIKSASSLIRIISTINPFTYCVDILRKITMNYSVFPVYLSVINLLLWTFILSFITIKIFEKIDIQK